MTTTTTTIRRALATTAAAAALLASTACLEPVPVPAPTPARPMLATVTYALDHTILEVELPSAAEPGEEYKAAVTAVTAALDARRAELEAAAAGARPQDRETLRIRLASVVPDWPVTAVYFLPPQ